MFKNISLLTLVLLFNSCSNVKPLITTHDSKNQEKTEENKESQTIELTDKVITKNENVCLIIFALSLSSLVSLLTFERAKQFKERKNKENINLLITCNQKLKKSFFRLLR